MPTFYARSTTVQLSIADLSKATTLHPVPRAIKEAMENVQAVGAALTRGSEHGTLTETPIYTKDHKNSHVRFLGKKGDMPFFMVHSGKELFHLGDQVVQNRRPARLPASEPIRDTAPRLSSLFSYSTPDDVVHFGETSNPSKKNPGISAPPSGRLQSEQSASSTPLALCATVFLSNDSFVRTMDRKSGKSVVNDIKIDIYFNGELCNSTYIPERYKGEAYKLTEQIIRFSGQRVSRLMEKPWVIIPHGRTFEGSLRENARGNSAHPGTQQRWAALSEVLDKEAEKFGRDQHGAMSVCGEYLKSLAKLEMPAEVEEMQKATCSAFGVLDVVIISGKGHKDDPGTPFLTEPTPIRVNRLGKDVNKAVTTDQVIEQRSVSSSTESSFHVRRPRLRTFADAEIVAQRFSHHTPRSTSISQMKRVSNPPSRQTSQIPSSSLGKPSVPRLTLNSSNRPRFQGNINGPPLKPLIQAPVSSRRTSLPVGRTRGTAEAYGRIRSTTAAGDYMAPAYLGRTALALNHQEAGTRTNLPFLKDVHKAALAAGVQQDGNSNITALPGFASITRSHRLTCGDETSTLDININSTRQRTSLPTNPKILPTSMSLPISPPNTRSHPRNSARNTSRRRINSFPEKYPQPVPQKRYRGPSSPSPVEEEPALKRQRMPYVDVHDDKQTLEEELGSNAVDAVALAAANDISNTARATRSSFTNPASSPEKPKAISSLEQPKAASSTKQPKPDTALSTEQCKDLPPVPRKVKLKLNLPSSPTKAFPPSSKSPTPRETFPLITTPHSCIPTDSSIPILLAHSTTKKTPDSGPATNLSTNSIHSHSPRSGGFSEPTAEKLDATWKTPALSKDCVITYAEKGVLRQIRAERGGWFVEEGVLMGTRFLVG